MQPASIPSSPPPPFPPKSIRINLGAVAPDDTLKDAEALAGRILRLKVWDDGDGGGRWKKSVLDMDYQVLLVSQFTLLARTQKGNKPDFHGACSPQLARAMYTALLEKTRELYAREKGPDRAEGMMQRVQDGVFGAMMQVALVNDGPVTFELSTPSKGLPAQPAAPGHGRKEAKNGRKKGPREGGETPLLADSGTCKAEEGGESPSEGAALPR